MKDKKKNVGRPKVAYLDQKVTVSVTAKRRHKPELIKIFKRLADERNKATDQD